MKYIKKNAIIPSLSKTVNNVQILNAMLSDAQAKKDILRLASFPELNPRPIIETDLNGNIIYANKSARQTFPDIIKKGGKHKYLSDVKKIALLLKHGQEYYVREIKVKNRYFRHFFYYTPPFNSIRIYGLDITEQKLKDEESRQLKNIKEQELKTLNQILKSLNDSNQAVLYSKNELEYLEKICEVISIDCNSPIVWISFVDKNNRIKLKPVVSYGISDNNLKKINTTQNSKIGRYLGLAIKINKPVSGKNILIKNTSTKYSLLALPITLNNSILGVLNICSKNTGFFLENEIKLFNELTDDISQGIKLFRLREEKEKTAEEGNNFITIISHELRNPLTSILASSQIIKSYLKDEQNLGKINSTMEELANIIERQSKTMARLLDDLLDVSKMSREKITLNKKIIPISEIVKNAIETTASLVNKQNQTISVSLPKYPLYLKADPIRLEQAVVNIINNAIKYTQSKGRIHIAVNKQNNWVQVSVKDNGPGINAKEMDSIFELFNSNSESRYPALKSFGIGLNITKYLISLHSGIITVKSDGENKGSEFIIKLPVWTGKEYTKTAQDSAFDKKVKSNLKILVVDDNKDISSLLFKILTQKGHKIKIADNGLSALKIWRKFEPDISLIDIGLPDMTGYQVAQKIRMENKEKNNEIKLIAITGYGQEKDKQMSKQAGFDYHITKPIDINSLTKILSS